MIPGNVTCVTERVEGCVGGPVVSAKLFVDFRLCTGHGRCYSESPDLLTYDEEGFVSVRHEPLALADDQLAAAQAAVDACPEQAMRIERDEVH